MRDRVVRSLHAVGLYPLARSAFDSLAPLAPASRRARRRLLNLYGQFVQPGDLCYDIGANVGNRTELFLALGARVIAIEPQESCFRGLQRRYASNPSVELVNEAVGREQGIAELLVSEAHPISSMSPEWVRRVQASGRFGAHTWPERVSVPITTLDALIEEYGEPAFCKIDVEGYEPEVLAGLSSPLQNISFEFTPEFSEGAFACVRRLGELGPTLFNFSLGDSGQLALREWVDGNEVARRLAAFDRDAAFGDVYARSVTSHARTLR
jgi:FkbM family methyltransferase